MLKYTVLLSITMLTAVGCIYGSEPKRSKPNTYKKDVAGAMAGFDVEWLLWSMGKQEFPQELRELIATMHSINHIREDEKQKMAQARERKKELQEKYLLSQASKARSDKQRQEYNNKARASFVSSLRELDRAGIQQMQKALVGLENHLNKKQRA